VATTAFQALFLAFFWYIFWMMSNALESAWSVFRFNVYLASGILFAVVGAFLGQLISPDSLIVVSPRFLFISIFFAFATLHPNIEFLLFFIIPMKVKWLAWFLAVITGLGILFAPSMGERIAMLAPLMNYILFFKDTLHQSVQARNRRAEFKAAREAIAQKARHTCDSCGATDQSHPDREFRYKMIEGDAVCICESCRREAEANT
jgi:hypothetical protein